MDKLTKPKTIFILGKNQGNEEAGGVMPETGVLAFTLWFGRQSCLSLHKRVCSPGVTLTVSWPRIFLAINLFSVSGIGTKCPSLRFPYEAGPSLTYLC